MQERGGYLIGLDTVTDCYSLFSTLCNPDLIRPTDESLVVYISALRQDLSEGRLRRLYWSNANDMVADVLTKSSVSREALVKL